VVERRGVQPDAVRAARPRARDGEGARLICDVSRIEEAEEVGGQREKLAESLSVGPTVLQSGPYRFFSSDRNEPTHVHVKRDLKLAKFWLAPVRMAYKYGFSQTELNRIAALAQEHEAARSKAWHDYFKRGNGNGGGHKRSGH
jgi:Domain of unknown function (DUF4160)